MHCLYASRPAVVALIEDLVRATGHFGEQGKDIIREGN